MDRNRLIIFSIAIIASIGVAIAVVQTQMDNNADTTTTTESQQNQNTPAASPNPAASPYKDGTYQATGQYDNPAGGDSVGVSLTVAGGKVSAATVTPQADNSRSISYQQRFASGISQQVAGKPLGEASVSGSINGSSLTGSGFNQALRDIQAQASS